jgi:hypothetical protein
MPEPANLTEQFVADIRGVLERNADAARKIGGVYQLNVTGARTLIIDLSTDKPTMLEGAPARNPSAVINLTEKDLQTLRTDPDNEGVKLFYAGKIKVEGSAAHAMSFTQIFKLK